MLRAYGLLWSVDLPLFAPDDTNGIMALRISVFLGAIVARLWRDCGGVASWTGRRGRSQRKRNAKKTGQINNGTLRSGEVGADHRKEESGCRAPGWAYRRSFGHSVPFMKEVRDAGRQAW